MFFIILLQILYVITVINILFMIIVFVENMLNMNYLIFYNKHYQVIVVQYVVNCEHVQKQFNLHVQIYLIVKIHQKNVQMVILLILMLFIYIKFHYPMKSYDVFTS